MLNGQPVTVERVKNSPVLSAYFQ